MRYKVLFVAIVLTSLAGGAVASPLFGPKGEFSTFIRTLKYDPSDACHKPIKPYSRTEYAMKNYFDEAERYLDCLKEASNADVKYATDVIAEGYEEASNDFLREVKGGY